MAVGTDIGTVVRPLPGYGDLDRIYRGIEREEENRRLEERKSQNDTIRAAKNRNKFLNKDYPLRYKEELGAGKDELLDMYADLALEGIEDPFSGTDSQSLEFQKKFSDWGNKVNFASQIDKHLSSQHALIQKQKPGYYTDDTVADMYGYSDLSLSDAINKELPMLKRRAPVTDRFEFISKIASRLSGVDEDFSEENAREMVLDAFSNTSVENQDLIRQYSQKYKNMSRIEAYDLDQRAARNGIGASEQLMLDDVMNQKKPFDPIEMLDASADRVEPKIVSGANENYSSYSYTDTKDLGNKLKRSFVDQMRANPASYMHYRRQLRLSDNATDDEVEQKAFESEKEGLMGRVKSVSKFNKRIGSGKSDKSQEMETSINQWSEDILSGDNKRLNRAIDYIRKELGTARDSEGRISGIKQGIDELKNIVALEPGETVIDIVVEDVPNSDSASPVIALVETETGAREKRSIRLEKIASEFGKNIYSEVFKKTGRHYGTDERGGSVQKTTPMKGFLNKR